MLIRASLDARTGTDRRASAQHGRTLHAFEEPQETKKGSRDATGTFGGAGKARNVAQRSKNHARSHHRLPQEGQEEKSTAHC